MTQEIESLPAGYFADIEVKVRYWQKVEESRKWGELVDAECERLLGERVWEDMTFDECCEIADEAERLVRERLEANQNDW